VYYIVAVAAFWLLYKVYVNRRKKLEMQDFMILKEETVLIVDDESCMLEAISNMLSTQKLHNPIV